MTITRLVGINILFILLLICVASAVPDTTVTAVTNKQADFSATGALAGSQGWFSWGYNQNMYWTTPNQTVGVGGTFTDFQFGSPMLTGESYNVSACDSTGCDPTPAMFAVPKATMLPITHYGSMLIPMLRSGFNVTQVASLIIIPYTLQMVDVGVTDTSGASGIVWGIFFLFVFAGYWLRGKGILLPSYLAIISGVILFGGAQIGSVYPDVSPIQIAPIFTTIGLPLLMIGFAGVFVSWFFNK